MDGGPSSASGRLIRPAAQKVAVGPKPMYQRFGAGFAGDPLAFEPAMSIVVDPDHIFALWRPVEVNAVDKRKRAPVADLLVDFADVEWLHGL